MIAVQLSSALLLIVVTHGAVGQQCDVGSEASRINCFPGGTADEESCINRGCCWQPAFRTADFHNNVPSCFYPTDYATYTVSDAEETDYGYQARLQLTGNSAVIHWPNVVSNLSLQVHHFPLSNFVRVRIFDPAGGRYEVPHKYPAMDVEKAVASPAVFLTRVEDNAKGITISDKDGRLLFDSTVAPLIFTDQFIQISTLSYHSFAYGFEQGHDKFAKPVDSWRKYALFARTSSAFVDGTAPGVHPFGMFMRPDASSYGMFFLNSDPMEIELTPFPAVTFRTIGGIIDMFIYAGATPDAVVKQHLKVVGLPVMPPYWATGLHLNGFEYGSAQQNSQQNFLDRLTEDQIPHDSLILDVEGSIGHKVWSSDDPFYSDLNELITKLHERNVRVVLTDYPTVIRDGKYEPYEAGVETEQFIKDQEGRVLFLHSSSCKSNYAIIDFTNQNTANWWHATMLNSKRNAREAIDGFFLNKNDLFDSKMETHCKKNDKHDVPPFLPGLDEHQHQKISKGTVCMSAQHAAGLHYDVHSLYGHSHAEVAHEVLRRLHPVKRPFIITRSSFAGTGKYAHRWINDVPVTWETMKELTREMLNYNLFGMPFVGAELCNSWTGAEEAVCHRWNQLVTFFPFMTYKLQEEDNQESNARNASTLHKMRDKVLFRYSLIPYYYTLFWRASTDGETVMRPLFWNFPDDTNTWDSNGQFMIGRAILVIPVLKEGATTVQAYIPKGRWYAASGKELTQKGPVDLVVLPSSIPFFILGGHILPMHNSDVTTEKMRKRQYHLVVALDKSNSASGEIYVDDGVSDKSPYLHAKFTVSNDTFVSTPVKFHYNTSSSLYSSVVTRLVVFGVRQKPKNVCFNNFGIQFHYDNSKRVLRAVFLAKLTNRFTVTWFNQGMKKRTGWKEVAYRNNRQAGKLS